MDVLPIINTIIKGIQFVSSLGNENGRLNGEIEGSLYSIKGELQLIEKDIENYEEPQMQELVYDIEDFICGLWIPENWGGFVLSAMGMDPRPGDLARIKSFRDSLKSLQKRQQNEKTAGSSPAASRSPSYTPEEDLVGFPKLRDEILKLLLPADVQQRRVISIVGCSGLGKTALARAVYDHLPDAFQCKSWVVASTCKDPQDLLNKVLEEVHPKPEGEITPLSLQDFLQDKRYLLFIDDVQPQGVLWKHIEHAFPENLMGSRIILTTSVHSVAKACSSGSYVYKMQRLDQANSEKLLWRKARHCEPASINTSGAEPELKSPPAPTPEPEPRVTPPNASAPGPEPVATTPRAPEPEPEPAATPLPAPEPEPAATPPTAPAPGPAGTTPATPEPKPTSSPALEDGSTSIFIKCDGLPLALISAGDYLDGIRPLVGKDCEDLGKALGDFLAGDESAFGEMKRALVQCYENLPDYNHKKCLLYVSIFPRGHQINIKSLVRRLMAEGLVSQDVSKGIDEELDFIRKCLSNLTDNCLIEPVPVRNNLKDAERCQVHSILLEFTIHKSVSKNFLSLILKDLPRQNTQGRVRRLSVQSSTKVGFDGILEEIGLSTVRSLTIFKSELPEARVDSVDFKSCKLLRVLDLEGCKGLNKGVLAHICELVYLTYLSLKNTDADELPTKVEKLQLLQTLDIRETGVARLPLEVIMLPKLTFLFGKFELPDVPQDTKEIEEFLSKKSKLHTLAGIAVNRTQWLEIIVLHARKLKKVKVWCKDTPAASVSTPSPAPNNTQDNTHPHRPWFSFKKSATLVVASGLAGAPVSDPNASAGILASPVVKRLSNLDSLSVGGNGLCNDTPAASVSTPSPAPNNTQDNTHPHRPWFSSKKSTCLPFRKQSQSRGKSYFNGTRLFQQNQPQLGATLVVASGLAGAPVSDPNASAGILASPVVKRLSNLDSLSIGGNGLCNDFLNSLKATCTISSIKLRGKLGRLPNSDTLSGLHSIRKLHLFSTGLSSECLSTLQSLPCLEYVKLQEDGDGFWDGDFIVRGNGFRSLHELCFEASKYPRVRIEQRAINCASCLGSLQLLCPESPLQNGAAAGNEWPLGVEGILHLEMLNEVILHHSADDAKMQAWNEAAQVHKNRPYVKKQQISSTA